MDRFGVVRLASLVPHAGQVDPLSQYGSHSPHIPPLSLDGLGIPNNISGHLNIITKCSMVLDKGDNDEV